MTLTNKLAGESADIDYDVAIVGFGPAGVVAAALLGDAGHKVFVCDRLTNVYQIPRAVAFDHEIMRVFQQLGVSTEIEPFTEPFTDSEYFGVNGQLIRRMTMLPPPYPQAHVPSVVFTQPEVEKILRKKVAALPNVDVKLGWEMLDISQSNDQVTIKISNDSGDMTCVRSKYLIACDGGISPVRTQLNMTLEDLDFDEPWLVVDVLVNDRGLAKLPKVSVQYCEPDRPCTLVLCPKNHRRFEISLKPGEDPQIVATPSETWKLLSRWISPEDGMLWRQSSYRFHALVAAEWRKGRVFLAGDAAHMQPPFLGQGMCQGIRDVTNLAWKLSTVLNRDCEDDVAEDLLNSYGVERKRHVSDLTTRIKAFGEVICERDPAKANARDARLLAEQGGVVRDTPRQEILPHLNAGLLSQRASSARGRLFPQPMLMWDGESTRMDEIFGNGWRLVLAPSIQNHNASERELDLRTIHLAELLESDGLMAKWFGEHHCVGALVRPDNYVFGTAETLDGIDELIAEAAKFLSRQKTVDDKSPYSGTKRKETSNA